MTDFPQGVEVILPSDRQEWLAARRQDVTASVAGCLLGVHPYITPYGLWAEKAGRIPTDERETSAMHRGRLLEPVAIQMLREDCPGWEVEYRADNAYYRAPRARIGATQDAFAWRPDREGRGIVQIKTAHDLAFKEGWIDPDTREVALPLWIAVQAIVEAHLTGCTWACVGVMVVGRGLDFHVLDVPVHAGVIERIREAVAEFWALADTGETPPVDWLRDGQTVLSVYRESEASIRDLRHDEHLNAIIERYQNAKEKERAFAREADTLRPQIIYALGNAERGETTSWVVSAPTVRIPEHMRRESHTRRLSFKRKDMGNGAF